MTWFEDDDSLDHCKTCELPLGQPLVCCACLCSLCSSCAVSTGEGELCAECYSDMTHFLADVEVTDVAQMPQHGQEQLPGTA